jgi:hypothetical protein
MRCSILRWSLVKRLLTALFIIVVASMLTLVIPSLSVFEKDPQPPLPFLPSLVPRSMESFLLGELCPGTGSPQMATEVMEAMRGLDIGVIGTTDGTSALSLDQNQFPATLSCKSPGLMQDNPLQHLSYDVWYLWHHGVINQR